MDFFLFLTIVAAAIGFFVIRRFRYDPENNETDSPPPSSLCSASPLPSLSPSSPPSSLSLSSPPFYLSPSSPPSSLSPLRSPSTLTLSSPPSSLSVSSPLSSSSHNWTHNVFPSFRGEDIRKNFLSHLKKEFQSKAITYFNDNGIKRGESIGPELIRAIRESKIAIILLSRNYASSKWCLDELVEIMKCKETVIPVFYEVNPSDVKKLRGYFGKVFEKTCEGKSKEDTENWRQALVKVATIAGYHSSTWDNEAAMIEEIATDVSNKLINSAPSSDFDNLVGMKAHMEKMRPLLLLHSNEVKMIGIWGPSGIGKTTIARFLFSQHSYDFQLSVFMEGIKRDYPCSYSYNAQLQLQKKFLSLILNQKDVTIPHLGVVQDRLKDKKVLVVLDDVDQSAQLNALAKELRWFGPRSRIIVTTQDKKILKAHGIDHLYEVGFPHDDHALKIFCINAFGQQSPYDGFGDLAREVTRLVGKLPLALSVMGSYFKGLSKEEWDHELPRLGTRLNGDIERTLKFSYDALCDEEQDLFLYIACFFNGARIEKVEEHLAKKFVALKSHLRVLAEKSLISIKWGCIEMHDLLSRLGREIVRKQSPNEPGQRQFLVNDGDTYKVLRNDTLGSQSVIGINLTDIELVKELKVSDRAFERMSNVQFLRLHSKLLQQLPHILDNLSCLPQETRLLHWINFPMTCLPSNFNPEFLVEINMCNSMLEKLWEGNKTIKNLKWMDLSSSRNLKELPDLSSATNLCELDLDSCSRLVNLPSSIGNVTNLKELCLKECSSLVELPSSIGNMTNLKNLDLFCCKSLVKLPYSIGNITNIKTLNLEGCSSLVELPFSIGNMTNLKTLNLEGCSSLVELPSSIGNITNLKELHLKKCSNLWKIPSSIGNMTNLTELKLTGCSSLLTLPSSIGNMTNLTKLGLAGCSSLEELPSSIGNMINIKIFYLVGCSSILKLPSSIGNMTNLNYMACSSLVELPSSIGNIINLKELYLNGCSSLVELPSSIGNMTNLEILCLTACSSLLKLPSSIGNMINLQDLCLMECSSLVEIPFSIGNMTNLKKLYLGGCSSLVEIPFSIGNMTNLEKLKLDGCSSLVEIPFSIGNMTNLKELDLDGCSSLVEIPSSSFENMTNLQELKLGGCSSLVDIPSSIGNMTNLVNIKLTGCSRVVELPFSIGKMTNLKELKLEGCSSLVEIPSSIGNLHNLRKLYMRGCSKLMTLPININMKSLDELDLRDCSSLKSFPEISTNISVLKLNGTEIEEIPPSIRSWSSLFLLHMPYSENLGKSQHAFDLISELQLSDTEITEIAPWVKEMSCLKRLKINGCKKLVSLPQLPESLSFLDVVNCEFPERLDCSFYKTRALIVLSFANCFEMKEESRDIILETSIEECAGFPGNIVPTYFTHQASGSSVSMKLNGLDTHSPTTSLRFKACVVLVNKYDVEDYWKIESGFPDISYHIRDKLSGVCLYSRGLSFCRAMWIPSSKKHLVVFGVEATVSSTELVFDFSFQHQANFEIKGCGIRPLESLGPSC